MDIFGYVETRLSPSSQEYWHRLRHEDFVNDLDLTRPDLTIPLVWHCDGVKIFKSQKAWVYSYSSILKKTHNSLANKMVLLVVRDGALVKYKTHDCIAGLIAFACKTLATGCFPLMDVNGSPFAENSLEASRAGQPFTRDGWRAVFSGFKSDLEARVQVHKMTRNYMANNICEHCCAGKDIPFTDFSSEAAWRLCRFSHEEFLMMNPARRQSAWVDVPGWRKERNLEDLLHTLHLGVACCSVAGLLIDHLQCKSPHLTLDGLDDELARSFTHYRDWCRKNKLGGTSMRFTRLRFGREKWTSLPELSQYKASTVKLMIYWVQVFLMEDGDPFGHEDRKHCAYSLAKFQWMLDVNGAWLSRQNALETADFGFSFLLFYQRLALRCQGEPKKCYKLVPKFHYFCHLCEYIERTHRNVRLGKLCVVQGQTDRVFKMLQAFVATRARYEHCYADESLMGQLSSISSSTNAMTMEKVTMHRYRVLLDLFLGPDMIVSEIPPRER